MAWGVTPAMVVAAVKVSGAVTKVCVGVVDVVVGVVVVVVVVVEVEPPFLPAWLMGSLTVEVDPPPPPPPPPVEVDPPPEDVEVVVVVVLPPLAKEWPGVERLLPRMAAAMRTLRRVLMMAWCFMGCSGSLLVCLFCFVLFMGPCRCGWLGMRPLCREPGAAKSCRK